MFDEKKKKELFEETLNEEVTTPTLSNDTTDYHKLAKENEYTQLLNKEIQLENAKNNAMKYTNNTLANQGFQTQGYGASNQTNILNNFLNSLGQAQNQTSANINNINIAEQNEKIARDTENFNAFTGLLGNATDEEEINDLFIDYGYGVLDENGKLVLNEKPSNLSDDQWLQIKAIYRNANKNAEANSNSPVMYSLAEMRSQGYLRNDGSVGKINADRDNRGFVWETKRLYENAENGAYQEGDVIKLVNHQNEEFYVEYHDGGFRFVNKKVYNEGKNKHTIKGSIKGKHLSSGSVFIEEY